MIALLLHLLRLLPFLCGGHRRLALENLALRQQLAVYKRTANRPKLQRSDRLLGVWLARVWPAWRQALVIVAPATVLPPGSTPDLLDTDPKVRMSVSDGGGRT